MFFTEERFPEDISYGARGGPEFSTDIIISKNGYEQRNVNWSDARVRYDVSHGVKTKKQMLALISFFRARRGMGYGFRFKDWADYQAVNQQIGTGDGLNKEFQLIKNYLDSSRVINKPVEGTVSIFWDDDKFTSEYVIDYTTGKVLFDTAPLTSCVIRADFEFDIPVRFNTDYLSISLDSTNTYSWNISIIEIKL